MKDFSLQPRVCKAKKIDTSVVFQYEIFSVILDDDDKKYLRHVDFFKSPYYISTSKFCDFLLEIYFPFVYFRGIKEHDLLFNDIDCSFCDSVHDSYFEVKFDFFDSTTSTPHYYHFVIKKVNTFIYE